MVSLISIISTIGIALGVSTLIVALSAMNGFEREIKDRILAVIPHGEIEAVKQPFKHWRSILERVRHVPGILAASPYINFSGLIEHGTQLRLVRIRGVNLRGERNISVLPNFLQRDTWENFKIGKKQIILGKGLANALGVKRSDYVTVMISRNNPEQRLLQPKRISLQVTDILQLGSQLDYSLALVPLEDAQEYLNMGDSITGVSIKVNEVFAANKLVRDAGDATQICVYIKSWIGTYGYMYRDIQMIRSIVYLVMIVVLCVACFNIISILVLAVKDKDSDIAVLRTMGAKDSLISAVFIWYGILAGLVGSLIGSVLGLLASVHLTVIIKRIEKLIGHSFLSDNVYFIDFLPSEVHKTEVVVVLAIALILSLLASWYPARRACHIDPARVLMKK